MSNFINVLKNKKVIGLFVSIFTVLFILMNSTYSLVFKENDTEVQSYTTGMLEITSSATQNSVTLSNSLPMEDSAGIALTPYTFKIENTGNLTYNFDVKLLSTTTENQINAQYIKLQVDDGEVVTLDSLTDGIILEDITLSPTGSINVKLKVWMDINTPNSEIGKTLSAKIATEGEAIYTNNVASNTLAKLGLKESEGTPNFSVMSPEGDTYVSATLKGETINKYIGTVNQSDVSYVAGSEVTYDADTRLYTINSPTTYYVSDFWGGGYFL